MQSVGTRLREARDRKGYSLDEISARTRITTRNLHAIDYDQVCDISSPFFYRSFVRQYAGEVGLEYNLLAPAVELLAGHMRQPDLPGQGEHQPVRVAPIQARPKRDFSWIVPAAVFIGVVVLGSGGYTAWKFYKPFGSIQNSAVSSLVPEKVDKKKPELVPAAQPTAASKPGSTPQVSSAPPKPESSPIVPSPQLAVHVEPVADKIHLELAATERTWLSVSADGKPAYTGILEATERKVLEGQESAKLRTGNAGGVNIIFNGKPIGSIGSRGQTRTVVFTKTGYEVQASDGARLVAADHIGG